MISKTKIRTALALFTVAVGTLAMVYGLRSVPAHAQARGKEFAPVGAKGDGPYTARCRSGYLIGLKVRSGAWIDQLTIICAEVSANGSLGPQRMGEPHGGGGGGDNPPKTCRPGEIVFAMGFLHTAGNRQVERFVFYCRPTTSNVPKRPDGFEIGNAQRPVFADPVQFCPQGEAAVGIQGHKGRHINSAGLLCGKFNVVQPGAGTGTGPGSPSLNADQQEILNAHNAKRALHCVAPMTWSAQLAANAQAWANACPRDKNGNPCHQGQEGCTPARARPAGEGESLSFGSKSQNGKFLPVGRTAQEAVNDWYCEIINYDFDNPAIQGGFTTNPCARQPGAVNGHFTQLVWKSTTQLGCAKNTCTYNGNTGTFWVCRYAPAGNINTAQALKENVLRVCTGQQKTKSAPLPNQRGEWSAFATNNRGRWGFGVHQATEASARALAINGCGGAGQGCKAFWSTRDRCVAFAESRANNGYWSAAGGGRTADQARQKALQFCQSGTAPRGSCKPVQSWCR